MEFISPRAPLSPARNTISPSEQPIGTNFADAARIVLYLALKYVIVLYKAILMLVTFSGCDFNCFCKRIFDVDDKIEPKLVTNI